MSELDRRGIRLAELVAVLWLGTDLGLGQPMQHVLRQCLVALRIGERLGLDEDERAVLYYTALLEYVGCHVDAYEQAKWLGDDLVAKAGPQPAATARTPPSGAAADARGTPWAPRRRGA